MSRKSAIEKHRITEWVPRSDCDWLMSEQHRLATCGKRTMIEGGPRGYALFYIDGYYESDRHGHGTLKWRRLESIGGDSGGLKEI